ncbi:hypothetical protein K2173_022809 [Erythroxylum novogranatense]|uniref:Uncharacterized protein n=1 Tax=Erythroxylum novogranatense TaxID=1862640 RepID=A0AAV8SMZ4_9ROSI|nr:hypothetical protein K2173_022809 [Erythroxylum novogranatense]
MGGAEIDDKESRVRAAMNRQLKQLVPIRETFPHVGDVRITQQGTTNAYDQGIMRANPAEHWHGGLKAGEPCRYFRKASHEVASTATDLIRGGLQEGSVLTSLSSGMTTVAESLRPLNYHDQEVRTSTQPIASVSKPTGTNPDGGCDQAPAPDTTQGTTTEVRAHTVQGKSVQGNDRQRTQNTVKSNKGKAINTHNSRPADGNIVKQSIVKRAFSNTVEHHNVDGGGPSLLPK